jgi:hypothetical protein
MNEYLNPSLTLNGFFQCILLVTYIFHYKFKKPTQLEIKNSQKASSRSVSTTVCQSYSREKLVINNHEYFECHNGFCGEKIEREFFLKPILAPSTALADFICKGTGHH